MQDADTQPTTNEVAEQEGDREKVFMKSLVLGTDYWGARLPRDFEVHAANLILIAQLHRHSNCRETKEK